MTTILIIDDSPTELHLFQNMLEKSRILQRSSRTAARKDLRQAKASRPDLILMDVVMPGMNGFQATRKLTQDPGYMPGFRSS